MKQRKTLGLLRTLSKELALPLSITFLHVLRLYSVSYVNA